MGTANLLVPPPAHLRFYVCCTGKRVVRRVRRLPPLSPGGLAPLAARIANQAEQHKERPPAQPAPSKLCSGEAVLLETAEKGGPEAAGRLGKSSMAPRGAEPKGAPGDASGERVEGLGGAAAAGVPKRTDGRHGSRPTSATLTHSQSNDSGYGSELGEGGREGWAHPE